MARKRIVSAAGFAVAFAALGVVVASANVALTEVSSDPYTNTSSYHATQVEPDTFGAGSTVVSAFQSGRFRDGGASNVGWATTINGGGSWSHGFLPGLTVNSSPPGQYDRATDASVAFDAKDNVWLVNSLGLKGTSVTGAAVVVNRSTDGGLTWGTPVTVAAASGNQDFDKNWIACDNNSGSSYYGRCYVQWDDFGNGNQLKMAYSGDGGQNWTASSVPSAGVIGGQPVVQPSGVVVVPIDNANETAIQSFVSSDGGAHFGGPYGISSISSHTEAGNLRSGPLPTAEIDGSGTVYVVWSDCRYERRCGSNDLVMSTSTNGTSWTAPVRIPIDSVGSGVDHFLPGLAVDRGSSGTSAHLALTYYYYPVSKCSTSTCKLDVGYVSSTNGGSSWSAATQLAGPIALGSLPNTTQGYMVGDYISTSIVNGVALPVVAIGNGKSCTLGNATSCNEAMYAPAVGLTAAAIPGNSVQVEPVLSTASDHAAPQALTHR